MPMTLEEEDVLVLYRLGGSQVPQFRFSGQSADADDALKPRSRRRMLRKVQFRSGMVRVERPVHQGT